MTATAPGSRGHHATGPLQDQRAALEDGDVSDVHRLCRGSSSISTRAATAARFPAGQGSGLLSLAFASHAMPQFCRRSGALPLQRLVPVRQRPTIFSHQLGSDRGRELIK